MSVFDAMQQEENFSETERQILQFIFKNRNAVEKLSIQELASRTYSSNATIIRMCRKLGFCGYRDFKIAFIRELENQKLVINTVDYSYPFRAEEPASVIVQNMYSLFKECIDMVQSRLDIPVLEQMVGVMASSQRNFLFGMGDTKLTIRSFINKGVKINFFPILATENDEQEYICQQIDSRDCTMFITYRGTQPSFDRCVKILRNRGVKILAITANKESMVAKYSDYCICIPDLEEEAKISTFYSQIVFQYILNLLFALLYRYYLIQ